METDWCSKEVNCTPKGDDMPGFKNVLEPWVVYDTIVIGHDFYGTENSVPGWFTTIANFAARDRHTFFKGRNEANCGLCYNNMQTMDKLDFAFHCFSVGLTFWSNFDLIEDNQNTSTANTHFPVFFAYDLPAHCGIEFKVAQDIKLEANSYMTPPGYGPMGIGVGNGRDTYNAALGNEILIQSGTQGIPRKQNRFQLDKPASIPRNEIIEGTLYLGELVANIMQNTAGPLLSGFSFWNGEGLDRQNHYVRYGIQMSLMGVREVQQRGQLHA